MLGGDRRDLSKLARSFARASTICLWLALGPLAVFSVAAFFAGDAQPFEVLNSFRLQFAASAAAAGMAAAIIRRWRLAISAGLVVLANLAVVVLWSAPIARNQTDGADTLTVMWANLEGRTSALEAVADLAFRERADVVTLTELPAGDESVLRARLPDFPCVSPVRDLKTVSTVAVLTRAPCGVAVRSRDSDVLGVDLRGWRVVGAHPLPPLTISLAVARDASIRDAVAVTAGPRRAVLVGDFNAVPWSPALRGIARQGLLRAGCGAPFAPTWSASTPLALTLDHAFVSPDLAVDSCRTGPDIGPDHRPLIITVSARA